ncbi:MAG: hypothetical protein ACOC44_02670 [Promethearchaeia archaeon]
MRKNAGAGSRNITIVCPICSSKKEIHIPQSVIKKNAQLTTISIDKGLICKHHFQAFIDKNFDIRGYQKVDFEIKKQEEREYNLRNNETLLNNTFKDGNYLRYDAKGNIDWTYLITENNSDNQKLSEQDTEKSKNEVRKSLQLRKNKRNKPKAEVLFQNGASYYHELKEKQRQDLSQQSELEIEEEISNKSQILDLKRTFRKLNEIFNLDPEKYRDFIKSKEISQKREI